MMRKWLTLACQLRFGKVCRLYAISIELCPDTASFGRSVGIYCAFSTLLGIVQEPKARENEVVFHLAVV